MTDSQDPVSPEATPNASIDEVLQETATTAQSGGDEVAAAAPDPADRPIALTTEQANALAAKRRPTVLVLAGTIGCGKTSVYAAIYERLGRGPFGGYSFAGSLTIPGFEERCHWWRAASGTSEHGMRHTQAADLPWLHIRIRDVERRGPIRDLLCGDFDGEFFDQFANNMVQADQLPFLQRADHVGVVVDGSKIATAVDRAAELLRIRYLLQRLLEPGVLAGPEALSLIVTKVDCFMDGAELAGAEDALAAVSQTAKDLAGRALPMLRLAVYSYDPGYPLGHGLESLLELIGARPRVQILAPDAHWEPATALGRFLA